MPNDIHIEEIITSEQGQSALQLSLSRNIFQMLYLAIVLAGIIFVGRLIYLGVYYGDFYGDRALVNLNRASEIPAPRGIIFDRFGVPLAQNQPTFSVALKISEYVRDRDATKAFLHDAIGIEPEAIDQAVADTDLEETDSVIIARDLGPDDLLALKAKEMPSIQIEDDFRRYYPHAPDVSHLLGYVDLDGVPQNGMELAYDDILAGKSGITLTQQTAMGKVIDQKEIRAPQTGANITTTIDADFQHYFYIRLLQSVHALNRTSGVGLAIDPRNGEVLSLVSIPSYDNNLFVKRTTPEETEKKLALLTASSKPLFNRAISGAYNPGSTIKPLDGVAALAENVISATKQILSIGYIELPNPYNPEHPSRFVDWRPQGWVDLYSALARSSNVYFYEVGGGFEDQKGLGIDKLKEWWQRFGLGKPTGIDIPGEATGFLPDPVEKEERTGIIWRVGDTYNVSIGQGDLLVTPIQLLNYIGAIANGGMLYAPHLKLNETSGVLADLTAFKPQIKEVQRGMVDAVYKPYGTASLLNSIPMKIAAKTGTAQISNNTKTNAFTVAYAPTDNPKIAVLVLVEDAVEGSLNSVPIARDVLEWYYEHRIKPATGN